MIKTLGIRLKRFAPFLIAVALVVALLPQTPTFAEGETFAFDDADKKSIAMTGGELAKAKSPDKLIFKSTDGKVFETNTKVTLQDGSTCQAVGRVTLEGTKFVYTPLASNQCQFMNAVVKNGTVTANTAQTNCSTSGTLSWVICPLTDLAQNISKVAAGIVEGLLYVEPLTLNTTNPIYVTWELVRNIANIAFIIMFLIIIFSQATSIGMSNYGIKRILPRLLVMAVLVNISYYLCAFAVDIANLLGAGVKGLVQVGIDAAPKPSLGGEQWDGSYGGFITASILAIAALAVAGPLWGILAALFSIVTFSILIGFVVLIARQVFLVLLIIVSPLAFVAALLPNTENWFTRWRKTFTTMLISYPIIMLVFYGSALVFGRYWRLARKL
ncbi:hypothetical protein TM7_0132 [candidate division TM7 genomosp. GTL1]|nr:hypothetical protein TM7_0132 [candidate division TM7 genomosp. GTL1]